MRVIVLNTNNIVNDDNNILVYKFPNSVTFKDNFIAVSSVSMYYSWYNISTLLQNNTFSYQWRDGAVLNTYTITIPDGIYEISTLNDLLQYNFIQNNHYLINSTGEYVYYAEFVLNVSRYAVHINTFLVPTVLPAGYTKPAPLVLPAVSFNPVITLPSKVNQIMGFVAGFTTDLNSNNAYVPPVSPYVSKDAIGTLSYISTTSPNVNPNSSIYFSMSNINNPYSQPSSIIYSLVPTASVGDLITERPPQFMWNKLIDGYYNELRLTFLGTDLRPIKILDPNMTILLTIRDKDENFTGK